MQKFILSIFLMVMLFVIPLSYIRIDARCIVEPGEPCTLSSLPEFLDSSGNPLTDIHTGQEVNIQLEIIGRTNSERAYVYIVLIEDNEGFTEQLSWTKDVVRQNETVTASLSWRPENAQDYTITILVWDDLENPTTFDPVRTTEASVTPLVRIVEGTANPEQKEYYSPRVIKVVLGVNNTVVWLNEDSTGQSVVSDQREFDSGFMAPGQTWTHTFTKTGIYGYHGKPWLRGEVIVLLPPEEEKALAARVCLDKQYVVKHPDVIRYVKTALYAQCAVHSEFIDDGKVERITIHTTGAQTVKGHWSTNYTVSYIDKKDIIVKVDSITREFLNMSVVEVPDESYNLWYNDDMKKILRFALQDDLARKFLESDDYYVRNIRYPGNGVFCSPDPCGQISVDKINSILNFGIGVNVLEGHTITVSTGFLYMTPFKIRILNDDPEPIPTFNVKTGESLDIPLKIVGQPSAKDETIPVKLDAALWALQDYRQYYNRPEHSLSEKIFVYDFSTPEIEIRHNSDLVIDLNVSVPRDFETGIYVLIIRGQYEDDKFGGTMVYLNVE